jgi:hypothetical protein
VLEGDGEGDFFWWWCGGEVRERGGEAVLFGRWDLQSAMAACKDDDALLKT